MGQAWPLRRFDPVGVGGVATFVVRIKCATGSARPPRLSDGGRVDAARKRTRYFVLSTSKL